MDTPAKMTKLLALERMKRRARKLEDQHLQTARASLREQQVAVGQYARASKEQNDLFRQLVEHFVGKGRAAQ
jgi:hypothetical protein